MPWDGRRSGPVVTRGARNLAVDLCRVSAIAIVVAGHWLVASVVYRDGRFSDESVLAAIPWTQWLTLLFQVIPVFFLLAGFGGAASLAAWRAYGCGGWAGWLAHRLARVLGPTTAYLAVMVAAVAALQLSGVDRAQLQYGFWAVALHLWFLPIYLALVCATPVLVAAHRRWGLALAVALTLAMTVLDVTARDTTAGLASYLLGWAAVYQLGIAWQAGALRPWQGIALAVAGVIALAGLVGLGPYPISMIGVPGADISNTSPPTPALLAFAAAQTGVLIAVAPATNRRLHSPRVQAVLSRANATVIVVYLWHMVPVAAAALALYPTGLLPQPATGSAGWWLWRLGWLAILTVLLGLLVAGLETARGRLRGHRLRVRIPLPGGWYGAALLVGTALVAYALFWLAVDGFASGGRLPVAEAAAYLAGAALVTVAGPGRPRLGRR